MAQATQHTFADAGPVLYTSDGILIAPCCWYNSVTALQAGLLSKNCAQPVIPSKNCCHCSQLELDGWKQPLGCKTELCGGCVLM